MSGADKQQLADLESLICATLQSLLRKVSPEDARTIAPSVMEALLLMFQTSAAGSSSGVLEDALMTVGVLVEGVCVCVCVCVCVRACVRACAYVHACVCVCIHQLIVFSLSLCSVLEEDFLKYVEAFFPYLRLALQNYAAYQVSSTAVHCG